MRKCFEIAPQIGSKPEKSYNSGMRNVFLIRLEGVSRLPSPGVVKQECADRLPSMCSQGGLHLGGAKHGFGSVQQFLVCSSPNKALEPTPPSVTPPAVAGVAPAGVVAHL